MVDLGFCSIVLFNDCFPKYVRDEYKALFLFRIIMAD